MLGFSSAVQDLSCQTRDSQMGGAAVYKQNFSEYEQRLNKLKHWYYDNLVDFSYIFYKAQTATISWPDFNLAIVASINLCESVQETLWW